MSPVEIFGMPWLAANRSACVPLPAPGGPKNTRFIGGTILTEVQRVAGDRRRRVADTERFSIVSTRVAASEPFENHFARLGEGFLAVFREYREHSAQERVLSRTEMVEHLGHLLDGNAFPPRRATARAIERDAVARRHVSKCIKPPEN